MPKERNNRLLSSRKSRSNSPYQLNVCPRDREVPHVKTSDSGRSLSKKDWEDAVCPICMNPPHNAVLLLCSSHEKGCRTYMCDTSYRHSNCLDQFKKIHTAPGLISTGLSSSADENSHSHAESQNHLSAGIMSNTTSVNEGPFLDERLESNAEAGLFMDGGLEPNADLGLLLDEGLEPNTEVGLLLDEGLEPIAEENMDAHELLQLACPLCRGQVKGWTIVERARKYLNTKIRSCSQESCSFEGSYAQLRKHARLEHPHARPTEVDPARQRDWLTFEQERTFGDVMSSIRSAVPGGMVFGDYVIEGSNTNREGSEIQLPGEEGDLWSFLLLVQYLDQNAHITISRTIPARVRARRNGILERSFAVSAENSEASASAQGDVSGSSARHNERFRRTFSLRVENSESGASAEGNVSGSNARADETDFATESPRRSSSRRQRGGHGFQ